MLTTRIWMFARTFLLLTSGCVRFATPHIQDAAAPGDTLALLHRSGERSKCDEHVQLVRSEAEATREFQSIAAISSTCSPGARGVCEQHLRERACELHADAVILGGSSGANAAPYGGSNRSLVSVAGRAVRWVP